MRLPVPLLTAATAAAAVVAPLAASPSAVAQTADDPAVVGSYGQPDEFAAVVNQSLALLALTAAGETPAPESVEWLTAQQCEDGAFVAYRPTLDEPCAEPDPTQVSGKDTNSTAYAVMALTAVGQTEAAAAAVDWLRSVQEDDGGWSFVPGAGTDPNSTGLVLSAFAATGVDAPSGGTDALLTFALGCDADEANRGGFTTAFDEPGTANALATAQAVPGAAGTPLPVQPQSQSDETPALPCPDGDGDVDEAASAGAGWLARQIDDNAGFVPQSPAFGDGPDVGVTAESVMSMVAVGCCSASTETAVGWLADSSADFVSPGGVDSAGALGKVALALVAADADPDLVEEYVLRIESTAIASPAATSTPAPEATDAQAPDDAAAAASPSPSAVSDEAESGTPTWVWWAVGAAVLVAAGAGVVAYRRRGRPRPSDAAPDTGRGTSGPAT